MLELKHSAEKICRICATIFIGIADMKEEEDQVTDVRVSYNLHVAASSWSKEGNLRFLDLDFFSILNYDTIISCNNFERSLSI